MVIVGMLFNPMNCLAYSFSDLYLSTTLFYGGLLMASNMMWGHEIVHYYQKLVLKQNSAKHNKEFYSFKKKFKKIGLNLKRVYR